MNEPLVRSSTSRWLVPGLLLASAVPVLAGAYRLAMVARLFPPSSDASRLLVASPTLAAHIVATSLFLIAGAFQLAPHVRERSPRVHRATGLVTAPAGLIAALSGLWLTATVAPGPYDGPSLYWIRVLVGAVMGLEILVGVAALGQRSFALHGAWMIRAYALGLGAGTQVLTHSALALVGASMTTDRRTVAMAAGWLVNALAAEWIVRRGRRRPKRRPNAEWHESGHGRLAAGSAVVLTGLLSSTGWARAEEPVVVPEAPRANPSAPAPLPSVSAPAASPSTGDPPSASPPAAPSVGPSAAPASAMPGQSTPMASPAAASPAPNAAKAPCSSCGPNDPLAMESPGSGIVGLRVAYLRSDSGGSNEDATTVSFAGHLEAHNRETDMATYRGRLDFSLGGGSAGLDGAFGGALLVGLRLPVSAHHSPFARIGLGGEIQADPRFLFSRFDLPLSEIGHQYVNDALLLEAGFRFSPVLTGRFRSNADMRELSSRLSFGAFATAQLRPVRFDALYTRIAPRDDVGRGLDSFQGLGCVLPFGQLTLCVDGQFVRDDGAAVAGGGSSVLTSGYIGGLLGVGRVNGSSPRR
jgi:hypothetical protein